MPSTVEKPSEKASSDAESKPEIPKVIEEEDMRGIRKNLETFLDDGDYMNVARTLARLRRSGVRLKKEKQETWFERLRDTSNIEQYREDPRKLALYYSYLKRVGALEEEGIVRQDQDIFSNYYSEQTSGKAEKHDRDFSRFCASMKFLGLRENFKEAREMVNYEVEAARKEIRGSASDEVRSTLSEGELNLRLARQKYLFGGELSTEDGETTLKEVEAAQEEEKWDKFLRNSRLYRYVSGNEVEIDHSTKRHLWAHLRTLRGKVQKYLSFAGDLTHLLRAEQDKTYQPEEIVEDSLDTSATEGDEGIGVGEEEVDEDTSATSAKAGDTAVIDKLEIPEDAELKPLEEDVLETAAEATSGKESSMGVHQFVVRHPDLLQRYAQTLEQVKRSVGDSKAYTEAVKEKFAVLKEINETPEIQRAQLELPVEEMLQAYVKSARKRAQTETGGFAKGMQQAASDEEWESVSNIPKGVAHKWAKEHNREVRGKRRLKRESKNPMDLPEHTSLHKIEQRRKRRRSK